MLSDWQVQLLAYFVKKEIQADFEEKHLSGNLMNTIRVNKTGDGFEVEIPAEIYNMYKFQRYGVVVYTGEGSYASELDEEGSAFYVYKKGGGRIWIEPRNHIGYVEDAIRRAIPQWMASCGLKGETTYL